MSEDTTTTKPTRATAVVAVKAAQRLWARLQEADMEQVLVAGRRLSVATLNVTRALQEGRRGGSSAALRPALTELLNAMLAARRAWADARAVGSRTAPPPAHRPD
jgi:hypothetical protein